MTSAPFAARAGFCREHPCVRTQVGPDLQARQRCGAEREVDAEHCAIEPGRAHRAAGIRLLANRVIRAFALVGRVGNAIGPTRANLVLDPFVAQQIVTGELSDDQNRAAGPNTRPSGNSPANWSRELCQSEGLGLPSRRHFCQPPFSTLALSNPKTRNSYQTRHAQYAFWAL
jgi:hypothetical protein